MLKAIKIRRTKKSERCSICRDDFGELSLMSCKFCGVRIHEECRGMVRSCPTLGCVGLLPGEALPGEEPVPAREPFLGKFFCLVLGLLGALCMGAGAGTWISLNVKDMGLGGWLALGLGGAAFCLTVLAAFVLMFVAWLVQRANASPRSRR